MQVPTLKIVLLRYFVAEEAYIYNEFVYMVTSSVPSSLNSNALLSIGQRPPMSKFIQYLMAILLNSRWAPSSEFRERPQTNFIKQITDNQMRLQRWQLDIVRCVFISAFKRISFELTFSNSSDWIWYKNSCMDVKVIVVQF